MQTYFVRQISATMIPIFTGDIVGTIDAPRPSLGTILSLSYFILHREQTGGWGGATKIGKYFVLITLGAVFGSTVLGRMALIIQRVQFLAGDPAFPWPALRMGTAQDGQLAPVAIVLFLIAFGVYLYRERKGKPNRRQENMNYSLPFESSSIRSMILPTFSFFMNNPVYLGPSSSNSH